MQIKRIGFKLFVDGNAPVDLPSLIPVFHRWIQQGSVPGLLIDVADYQHVHHGPGVVLIGYECDYSLDLGEGRPGLCYLRKRDTGELAGTLRGGLHALMSACAQLEQEAGLGIQFRTGELLITAYDRLSAPNTAEAFESLSREVQAVVQALYGTTITLLQAGDDPRQGCGVRVTAEQPPALKDLVNRLTG